MKHIKIKASTLSLGLAVLILMACDPYYSADIINKGNSEMQLELHYDRIAMENLWNGKPILPFLNNSETIQNKGGQLISFDTINLKATILLSPGSIYSLEGGLGIKPRFTKYKRILVRSEEDSLIIDSENEMFKLFKKVGIHEYQWVIK